LGFQFHAVLVVHSVDRAWTAASDTDRWIPLLWAIDEFKQSQARDAGRGDWTKALVRKSDLPPAERAGRGFASAHEIYEAFAMYSARDFRSIGHKAIYVANG